MVSQTFHISVPDWSVKVFYEVERRHSERIMHMLEDMGAHGEQLAYAKDVLRQCKPNTGFTISSPRERCSVIVMSWTTSADQFANTFDHEKRHLSMHIADECGMDIHGEEYAYLAGTIAQKMFSVARRFMCDCCRWKR